MSKRLDQLIENNRLWAEQFEDKNPGIFNKLVKQQNPDYLWIGCSDSRVPANTIIGLQPGEVFVHRNVGNLVNHSDINVLTVLEYAVKILGVKDIILCGHYGCGGIKAAMEQKDHGIVDNWIRSVKDIYHANQQSFEDIRIKCGSTGTKYLPYLNCAGRMEKGTTIKYPWCYLRY